MSGQHRPGTTDAWTTKELGHGRADAMTPPNTAEHTSIDQPGPPRDGHVLAWTTWADLTWAGTCTPWMPADGLSAGQRLLLGLVLFGSVTYRQAADRTGLTQLRSASSARPPCDSWPWQGALLTGRLGYDWPGQPDRPGAPSRAA